MNPLSLKGTPPPTTGWQDRLLATVKQRAAVATPPPSVTVTLGASSSDAVDTYAFSNQSPAERYSNEALGAMLQRNVGSSSAPGLFAGLGKALLSRLGADPSDVSLDAKAKAAAPVDGIAPPLASPDVPAEASLTVKLASGASVTLSLRLGDGGLSIDMHSSAELGEQDRQSVAKLGGAFQDMLDGLGTEPPTLSLQGLTEGDSRIASVDFKARVPTSEGPPQTIEFHSGADTRTVKVDGPGGKIDVAMDMRNAATWGNQAQRKASVSNYLDQIDAAASRGRGDKNLVALFKSAFGQLNASYPPTPATGPSDGIRALNTNDHAVLTGLADFTASIGQAGSSPNPLHPDEVDSFSYQLSQSTQFGGTGPLDRTIDQHQASRLKASYHMALSAGLSLQLTTKPESQNYIYRQVDDSASSDTHIAYAKGRLTDASVTQSASQTTHDKKYVMAKLVSDTTTPSSRTQKLDLRELLDPPHRDDDDPRQPPVSQATLDRVHAMIGLVTEPGQLTSR
ncbi:MAG: hypothetical protein GAK28_04010 [Luteibacter sp.]|uniref:hypothetical protein n=1 Tax=Luteibacter sp. TaxID=1886636 RepID=UPI001382F7A8|nr:hypothetical protein [Luteibacter sp.]KAF1004488.1 MAG: hypothetical protein GAK28_04010 [Luteibacter sp.]